MNTGADKANTLDHLEILLGNIIMKDEIVKTIKAWCEYCDCNFYTYVDQVGYYSGRDFEKACPDCFGVSLVNKGNVLQKVLGRAMEKNSKKGLENRIVELYEGLASLEEDMYDIKDEIEELEKQLEKGD